MIGTQIGPLVLVRRLGSGGMGEVYLAEHTVLRDLRAVKILLPELTQRPAIVQRFVNEARAAATLRHRNLIRVHDVGQLPDGGPWFMVLDYLDGGTLARFAALHGGPVAPHLIVHVLAQVANGLQVAHDHAIVHRDLKPENIFLIRREGDPQFPIVLDFGVAQLSEELAASPGTQTGTVIGTPSYMPPEQLRGERVGPAADIFALGVIAYELSTGGWFPYQHAETRAAYGELAPAELYFRARSGPPVDPRERSSELSDAWAHAILTALDPEPANRPASARAFALLLAEAAPSDGLHPDGLEIVRQRARELTETDSLRETIRSPRPAPIVAAASRYQLGDRLGAGGMAEVFAGTQLGVEGFARKVAIKRVLAGFSAVPAFATMFVSEARIASRLAHPNIVAVLDFSRDPEDRLFLVMEHVDGRDLASVLEAGPLAPSTIIYVVTELLRGLGYAHDLVDPDTGTRGVVHRDVSPQNVLLGFEGAVKVADFGLAKARDATGGARSETVRGKPRYMSPEQANSEPLDGRSDLFAVGVMLWEMLARRPLFAGTPREIIAQVLFKDVVRPGAVRSRIPTDVEDVAMKLLARDRDQRYPHAEDAIDDLLRCEDAPRDGRGELAQVLADRFPTATSRSRPSRSGGALPRALVAAQIPVPVIPTTLAGASPATPGAPTTNRRWPFLVGVVSAVIVAGVVGVLTVGRGIEPTMPQDATTPIAGSTSEVAAGPIPTSRDQERPSADPTSAVVDGGLDAIPLPPAVDARPARSTTTPRGRRAAPPAPTAPPLAEPGEIVIVVRPWAQIWIDGRPVGQTPYRALQPAGRHRVRLVNDDEGRDETTAVTVSPDRTTTLERTWR